MITFTQSTHMRNMKSTTAVQSTLFPMSVHKYSDIKLNFCCHKIEFNHVDQVHLFNTTVITNMFFV